MTNLQSPPPPKRRGCFFYGCITSLAVLGVMAITIFFVTRYVINRVNRLLAEYTETSPMALPKVKMPAEELKKLKDRMAAFDGAMESQSNTAPLILTDREINALLGSSPQLKDYRDEFYISLEGDQIKGQMSLPLDTFNKMPLLDLKGRYLNGTGILTATITNGTFYVSVKSLEVKGKPLPESFLGPLRQENLAKAFNRGTNATAFERYESVQVKDGVLIIKAKEH